MVCHGTLGITRRSSYAVPPPPVDCMPQCPRRLVALSSGGEPIYQALILPVSIAVGRAIWSEFEQSACE